ncbi:MAG: DNA-directed RNA polymerase [Parvibaculum sp.]|uniref:DNA-directed RNA polymerase n=1 Tax=Parvibaculum sp. TaxID=2024848 RepID=UPI00271BAF62|nr:DNA-directed RNA polymerase [Parvibaculum sp.]MDO8839676.1 DNA-directed RNA polymerase [Parvibaculum sp.]
MDQVLFDRQVALEENMVSQGVEAYRSAIAKAEQSKDVSTTPPVVMLMKKYIEPLSVMIADFVTTTMAAKRGRRAVAAKYLNMIEPQVAAFIALKVTLGGQGTRTMLVQGVATSVANRLEDEVRFREFATQSPRFFRFVQEKVTSKHTRHRRTAMNNAFNKSDVVWEDWPKTDKVHLGMKLIEMVQSLGLVEVRSKTVSKNDTRLYLEPTEALCQWIEQMHGRCELLMPVKLPFLIPPKDWTSPFTGAYHTAALRPLSLVKTTNRNYLQELSERVDEMEKVYTTVNAMQRTPWKVNADVLATANEAWERGLTICKLPARDSYTVPPCPLPRTLAREDMTEEQAATLAEWKRAATKLHDENARLRSRRVQTARTLQTAMGYADEVALFFPYQLDFRSRIYAVPAYLNPQGNDLSKALLTFAEGAAITDDVAVGWLAVHGANTFGEDKVTLDERVQWVTDNSDRIEAIAADPFADLWWTEADSPWCFLAFCYEWAALQTTGYGYVSHLPVAMDATCSGIQHFSAMLRDEHGGAAVNLIPGAGRQDIYQQVANKVLEKLHQDIAEGVTEEDVKAAVAAVAAGKKPPVPAHVLAALWLEFEGGTVSRGATKRSVMVLPYGGTLFSSRSFVEDYMREKIYEDGRADVFGDERSFSAAIYLAKHIWSSISDVVIGARSVMNWLQGAARVLAKDGRPVSWVTPAGFPVLQSYFESKANRVKTHFGDTLVYLTLLEQTSKLDVRGQANGISPNFVHANDAAHLCITVDLAINNGVKHFAMIHDSFGTHAAHTNTFAACIREAFVDMYDENDVLENFREEVGRMLDIGAEIAAVPPRGLLDLEQVKHSEFFFS